MNASRHALRQAGLSLVELLVALALSLFLIAGIVAVYFSTDQSYHVQQQAAQLQERERLAATFVGSVVQSAGYYGEPATYYPELAFPANATFTVAGQSVTGTHATYPGGSDDTVTVRYLTAPDDGVLNCLGFGNSTTSAQLFVNRFQLDTADDQLECTLSRPGFGTQTQPLLDGVTSFAVTYGIDTDGDGSANRYVTADNVGNWGNVRSVKIDLEFAADNPATGLPEPGAAPIPFKAVFPIRATSQ